MKIWLSLVAAVTLAVSMVTACTTSPTGRKTIKLFPSSQMAALGAASFDELKGQQQLSTDRRKIGYVRCISEAIVQQLPEPYRSADWEVQVFESKDINAFALPGEKIGVYTGLMAITENQDQLAAVIGHEIAHVIAEHANERMTAQVGAGLALQIGGAYAYSEMDSASAAAVMTAMGIGMQVGALLPFSRVHESEADQLGVDYMLEAGFNPAAAADLWRNMAAANGAQGPEWLSTHPASATRIRALEDYARHVQGRYQQVLASGTRPQCQRPF